jgi:hypothetical protein
VDLVRDLHLPGNESNDLVTVVPLNHRSLVFKGGFLTE